MKYLSALFLCALSVTASANETFECDFTGPNYILSFENNGSITLSNSFKTYECSKGFVNLPGTEAELSVLNCGSGSGKQVFYANENGNGDIVLSKGLVFSKDIICKKQ